MFPPTYYVNGTYPQLAAPHLVVAVLHATYLPQAVAYAAAASTRNHSPPTYPKNHEFTSQVDFSQFFCARRPFS